MAWLPEPLIVVLARRGRAQAKPSVKTAEGIPTVKTEDGADGPGQWIAFIWHEASIDSR